MALWTGVLGAQITISPDAPLDQRLVSLRQALESQISKLSSETMPRLVITIGPTAFEDALETESDRPILATLLSSTQFEQLLRERPRPDSVTAIFSNPDPLAQEALSRWLLGNAVVGVFVSPNTQSLLRRLEYEDGVSRIRKIRSSGDTSIDVLLRQTNDIDALIALPDAATLNRSNINHVVRVLYQQRKVLFGYSDTLTQVGALASIFPDDQAQINAIVQMATDYAAISELPAPRFVWDLKVTVNERLARSLNLPIRDTQPLLESLRSAEGALIQ